jgi:hypothetical protein
MAEPDGFEDQGEDRAPPSWLFGNEKFRWLQAACDPIERRRIENESAANLFDVENIKTNLEEWRRQRTEEAAKISAHLKKLEEKGLKSKRVEEFEAQVAEEIRAANGKLSVLRSNREKRGKKVAKHAPRYLDRGALLTWLHLEKPDRKKLKKRYLKGEEKLANRNTADGSDKLDQILREVITETKRTDCISEWTAYTKDTETKWWEPPDCLSGADTVLWLYSDIPGVEKKNTTSQRNIKENYTSPLWPRFSQCDSSVAMFEIENGHDVGEAPRTAARALHNGTKVDIHCMTVEVAQGGENMG